MAIADAEPIILGRVSAVHGVKGWVKVFSHTEPKAAILSYRPWLLAADRLPERQTGRAAGQRQWRTVKVLDGRPQGKTLVAHIEGCDDRDSAQQYIGLDIAVYPDQLAPLAEGEHYWHQLEGLAVISEFAGQTIELGRVDHLLATGANDVLVVKSTSGSLDQRERLLPYIDDVVLAVDLEAKTIRVDWDPEF